MTKGKFIVIEGGEGVGKTTVIDGLKKDFSESDNYVFTREPGATALGKKLRELLLNQDEFGQMDSTAELLIFAADRMEHVSKTVAPACAEGKTVVCDRFAPSTFAYQIRASGAGEKKEKFFHDVHLPIFEVAKPDYYILLDLPIEKSFERMKEAGKVLDSIELRGEEFHRQVRSGMKEYIEASGVPFVVVNADQSREDLLAEIKNHISNIK